MSIDLMSPEEVENAALKQSGLFLSGHEDVDNYIKLKSLSHKIGTPTEQWLRRFLTKDADMLIVKNAVNILAPLEDPVLLIGETGTGKEILAHALHGSRSGDFVALNCAAVQDTLIESELCGAKRGAFTGAENTQGLIQQAGEGTIFFDEINSASPGFQAKLLRIIESKKFRKVGSSKEEDCECRFVFAANIDLADHPTFRKDLYYRISTFTLKLKPLRDRREDVELIAKSLDYYEDVNPVIPNSCYERGNVRSLIAFIRRQQVLGELANKL